MASQEELTASLNSWVAKLEDPTYKEKFASFEKTLQFNFTDQEFHILMVFKDGVCELMDGAVDSPDIVITTSTDTIMGISNKKIKPLMAFMSGKLKAKGSIRCYLMVAYGNQGAMQFSEARSWERMDTIYTYGKDL